MPLFLNVILLAKRARFFLNPSLCLGITWKYVLGTIWYRHVNVNFTWNPQTIYIRLSIFLRLTRRRASVKYRFCSREIYTMLYFITFLSHLNSSLKDMMHWMLHFIYKVKCSDNIRSQSYNVQLRKGLDWGGGGIFHIKNHLMRMNKSECMFMR